MPDTSEEGATPARQAKIAVIIPSHRVSATILDVLSRVGPECWRIYVVDDACPEKSGDLVEAECRDPRVRVLRNEKNLGVGGATVRGYDAALADDATILVKVDGDGQMAPELLPSFVRPILDGDADYAKGNRFHDLNRLNQMPLVRVFGNAALTFMTKLSAGYWDIFDPTNGYTALHAEVARYLPRELLSKRYFFETDMLFRLNIARAAVIDVPMDSRYGREISGLRIRRILPEFLINHTRNATKRLFYNYFLRDFSLASLELVLGVLLLAFGTAYGLTHWVSSYVAGVTTPAGTVMLAALPVLLGLQLLLAFVGFDIAATPRRAIHPALLARRQPLARAATAMQDEA